MKPTGGPGGTDGPILRILAAILLTMLLVLAAAAVEYSGDGTAGDALPQFSPGVPHPDYPSMDRSGEGASPAGRLFWLGLSFGLLQAALITALLALAFASREKPDSSRLPLLGGGLVYAGVMSLVFYSYRTYSGTGSVLFWGGFPAPTAWLVYGIWGAPWIFVVYFIWGFHRSYLSHPGLTRFEQLLKRRKDRTSGRH